MKTTATYKLPSGTKVKLRELKIEEYISIVEAWASKNSTRMVDELVKKTIVSVGDKDVTSDSRDSVWSSMSAKERDLIRKAYAKLHSAQEDETSDFFGSEEVEVSD